MATKVGVGKSNETEAFKAGSTAAKEALSKAGLTKCDFVFLFSTVGYNQEELLKGVRSVTQNAPLSGCSGEGLITQAGPEGEIMFSNSASDKGKEVVGVMVFSSDEIHFTNYLAKGLNNNSQNVGQAIGKQIVAKMPDKPLALMMFLDGLTVNVKQFFSGIDSVVGKPLLFCGGLAGDNFAFGKTYQYHNDQVLSEAATCVLLSGNVNIELAVSHGCVPIGLDKTITKAKANTIYEIDNTPIWDFVKDYLEGDTTKFTNEVTTFLNLGERLPDDVATEYDKYIIRAPLSQNPDKSLNFAYEIKEGAKVQLIRRVADKISNGAREMAERIKRKLGGKKPIAILHIDCAARGKMFFGDKVKEKGIDVMQNVFGKDIPWLGFYSYGEIAPIKKANHYHNQTAVICVIY